MDLRLLEVVHNPRVIDLVTKSVLHENGFKHVYTNIRDHRSCYIVYLQQQDGRSKVIVLAIQKHVSKESTKEAIEQCLSIYETYGVFPCFVLLCTGTTSPSVESSLIPYSQNPNWRQLKKAMWADKCFYILNDAVEGFNKDMKQQSDPLILLAWFLSNYKDPRLENFDNPTIQLLKTVEMSVQ